MFPTSLLDNIIVLKSFTADLPADFTGGIIDIATKDFPDEKIMGMSVSAGYNPSMHFNQNFVSYPGGSLDFLGFDDGTRNIPTGGDDIPQYASVVGRPEGKAGQRFRGILEGFNPNLAAKRAESAMDCELRCNISSHVKKRQSVLRYSL